MINKNIRNQANDGSGAREIAESLWNSECYYGVHVIKRYVDEWTSSDMADRMKQEVGDKKTVIVWAIEGKCPKDDEDVSLPSLNLDLAFHEEIAA